MNTHFETASMQTCQKNTEEQWQRIGRNSAPLQSPEKSSPTSTTTGSKKRSSPSNEPSSPNERPTKKISFCDDVSPACQVVVSPSTLKHEVGSSNSSNGSTIPVRRISLLSPPISPAMTALTPEEKIAQRAEIADILDQATRVALEIGSSYETGAGANIAPPLFSGESSEAPRRRYQRRNSFVDRRRFLAPSLVNDTATATAMNDFSETNCSARAFPFRPSLTTGTPSEAAVAAQPGVTTVRSAVEAEFLRRRSSMPLVYATCQTSDVDKP